MAAREVNSWRETDAKFLVKSELVFSEEGIDQDFLRNVINLLDVVGKDFDSEER